MFCLHVNYMSVAFILLEVIAEPALIERYFSKKGNNSKSTEAKVMALVVHCTSSSVALYACQFTC